MLYRIFLTAFVQVLIVRMFIYSRETKPNKCKLVRRFFRKCNDINSKKTHFVVDTSYKAITLYWAIYVLRTWYRSTEQNQFSNRMNRPTRKMNFKVQSTTVISNSKGLCEILRDIRTSTYQICTVEEKIYRTATFRKWICTLTSEFIDLLLLLLSVVRFTY